MKSPEKAYFPKGHDVPNSDLPVLVYRSALDASAADKARLFRNAFRRHKWVGLWTDTIYDYTHFHSNAHEVLGIAAGKVTVQLGGDAGRRFRLKAGDMVVIPAGVGHCRIGDDEGLKVIGAYPRGQSRPDMKKTGRSRPRVALPTTDPLHGPDGPLLRHWR